MRRYAAVSAFMAFSILLSACSGDTQSSTPKIFDREQVAADHLPDAIDVGRDIDTGSVRYVGEDADGDRYWVALADGDSNKCVIFAPSNNSANEVFCGELGFSAVTQDGKRIEFASTPKDLRKGSATAVGDTLLVG